MNQKKWFQEKSRKNFLIICIMVLSLVMIFPQCAQAAAKKPTLNQLKVSYTGYKYYPNSAKLYIKTRLTNKSKATITKVTVKYTIPISEDVVRSKTFSVNIKPGKTVNKQIYIGKVISHPYQKVKVKALKYWYKM